MSNLEDQANGVVRHYGAQEGQVTDNKDPEGLHRVRVHIPGLAEPSTDWCFPLTAGGGSPQRGGHIVPDIGADVLVWFHRGDPNANAYYMCAHWGLPDGADPECPVDINIDKANAHQISSWQFGKLSFTVDEREGKRRLMLRDDDTEDHILWDLETKQLEISITTGIVIKSVGALFVKGLQTFIHNRYVVPNGQGIG